MLQWNLVSLGIESQIAVMNFYSTILSDSYGLLLWYKHIRYASAS